MITVDNEKDLGHALKNGEDTIEIEGDLIRKVFRIKATNKVAWAVAIGAIAVSVVAILAAPATFGISNSVHVLTAPIVITSLGVPATAAAISIAVAGGVAVLNKLRKYKVIEKTDKRLLISKK